MCSVVQQTVGTLAVPHHKLPNSPHCSTRSLERSLAGSSTQKHSEINRAQAECFDQRMNVIDHA